MLAVIAPRNAHFCICLVAESGKQQIAQVFLITGDASVSAGGFTPRGPVQYVK